MPTSKIFLLSRAAKLQLKPTPGSCHPAQPCCSRPRLILAPPDSKLPTSTFLFIYPFSISSPSLLKAKEGAVNSFDWRSAIKTKTLSAFSQSLPSQWHDCVETQGSNSPGLCQAGDPSQGDGFFFEGEQRSLSAQECWNCWLFLAGFAPTCAKPQPLPGRFRFLGAWFALGVKEIPQVASA